MSYAIRFDFGGGAVCYAGLADGAFGFAPTLDTAIVYESEDNARRVLEHAYGKDAAACGEVIAIDRAATT